MAGGNWQGVCLSPNVMGNCGEEVGQGEEPCGLTCIWKGQWLLDS